MLKSFISGCLGLAILAHSVPALARVKLVTLPVRDSVTIRLDHPHATLVREVRVVPLKRGVNQIDFSWANTRIDPASIVFQVAPDAGEGQVQVLSVSYPPKEQALVWSVSTPRAGPARVAISYVLGGLERSFQYRVLVNADESRLALRQYLKVRNNANEAFTDARLWLDKTRIFDRPVGLNESREMLVREYKNVPVTKTFTVDRNDHGYLDEAKKKLRVGMHYVLRNDPASGLGQAALPDGKVRIFQRDKSGSSAFLGEDWGAHTPLGERMRLFIGLAREVEVKRTIAANSRRRITGNLYQRRVRVRYELRNFKSRAVTVNVIEQPAAVLREVRGRAARNVEWQLGSRTSFSQAADRLRSDASRLVLPVTIPPTGSGKPMVREIELVFGNEW